MKPTFFLILVSVLLYFPAKAQDTSVVAAPIKPPAAVRVPLDKSPEALGISPKVAQAVKAMANAPVNIALFGVDRRTADDLANSDVIMIISIDQQTGKIKMSSILRDSYVKIDGKGMDKINAAFATGGPQLAIKTLNQNFDLDIKDYINVDFYSAARIVNALGGVNIDIKPAELPYLNNYLDELAIVEKDEAEHVKEPGLQRLNGKQTVAYTRIRAVGHGDYERTERQRSVLIALFDKIKSAGPSMFPVFATQVLPNLETSMNNMALMNFAGGILNSKNKTIEQARFPLDNQSTGKRINNIWYLTIDLKATTTALHNFIYKNIKPGTAVKK